MSLKFIYLVALLSALLGVSCRDFKEISVSRIDGFRLEKLSLSEIEGDLQLTIKNPNQTGFSIYRSEFDIYYGNVKLGKARLHKRVHIGGNSEKTYTFRLKSKPENLNFQDLLQLLGNAGSGAIRVQGDLKAGKFFIKKSFPVYHSEKIRLGS